MKVFLDDGEVPLDNDATEGALCSFCLYKHAWKLIDCIDGAKSSAIIYSITETVKVNHLNPFRYLTYVLPVLKDYQDDTVYRIQIREHQIRIADFPWEIYNPVFDS